MRIAKYRLLIALSVQACTVFGQPDPWARVGLIEQGRKVEVRQKKSRPVAGKFVGFDSSQIKVMRSNGEVLAIAKSDATRVSLVIGKSRGKKAAIASGVTAGALVALIGAACLANDTCAGDGAGLITGVVVSWAGIAGGIAALFPPHRETIYQALPDPGTKGRGNARRR